MKVCLCDMKEVTQSQLICDVYTWWEVTAVDLVSGLPTPHSVDGIVATLLESSSLPLPRVHHHLHTTHMHTTYKKKCTKDPKLQL